MKAKSFAFLSAMIILFLSFPAFAADHYIRQGATGGGSGTDWTNAWTDMPTSWIRGDTYWVADGTYSARTYNTPVYGTSVITIKKATTAEHGPALDWSNAYGGVQAVINGQNMITTSYWMFDGSTRNSDWKSGYGFKINTGQACGFRTDSPNCRYVIIQYFEIQGQGDDGAASPDNNLIMMSAFATNAGFWTVSKCYLHDAGECFLILREADDGIVEYCYMARNESVSSQHSEGISSFVEGYATSPSTDRWIIRYNVWEDVEGTGVIVWSGSGWEIYGNLVFETGLSWGTTNGSFCSQTASVVTNTRIYNNTLVDCSGINSGFWFSTSGTGNLAYNNLFYNCNSVSFASVTHDYNTFTGGTYSEAHGQNWTGGSSLFANYSNDDFRLAAATDAGMSLPAPYNTDLAGIVRGGDGTWDRGAYEFLPGGMTVNTPTGLQLLTQ